MSHDPETPDTQSGPQKSLALDAGLAALRRRLIERAVMCSSTKQEAIAKGWWHEAHEAEVRREIWLRAADMAEEEICAANTAVSHDQDGSRKHN